MYPSPTTVAFTRSSYLHLLCNKLINPTIAADNSTTDSSFSRLVSILAGLTLDFNLPL